jgi:hypothetical protein
MTQAGISTVICVLPLILLQNYIPAVFFKTISLVVIWGLFHGLVMLPAFLVAFPRHLLEMNCYRTLFQKVHGRHDVAETDNGQTATELEHKQPLNLTRFTDISDSPT